MNKKETLLKAIILIIVIIAIVVGYLLKGKKVEQTKKLEVGKSTNLVNKEERNDIKKILEEKGLSNIGLYLSWVEEFNKEEDLGCGMVKSWTNTKDLTYNDGSCADRWEKNHELMDGNCRITAFSLLQELITTDKSIKETGPYLMFDIDVIETNKDYKNVLDDLDDFATLFNEINVKSLKSDELQNVYSNHFKEHNIKINSNEASLISVVLYDPTDKALFVGHAGVLVKLDDNYLFIEKIAFEQPYQISVIKEKEDLKDIFANRPTYFSGEENEIGPFVYENDKLLFKF